jgi:SAM-dependent methyltransferase
MDPEESRRASFESWEVLASGWERRRAELEEALRPMREWLLQALAPRPGDTVLELAAGPGGTGFAAAAAVGEQGRLISTDFSPAMVEVARRRSAALGLRNVEHVVADAERLDLAGDSVDGVLCQSGYMLMSDPAAALAETRRVLRPGGRLALSVWGAPERNAWAAQTGRFLVERGHVPPAEPDAPGVFSLASEERLRALLAGAGFTTVRTEDVPVSLAFGDVDAYLRWLIDVSPAGLLLRDLPAAEREALVARLTDAFAPFAVGGGYALPGVALCAVAA